MENTIANRINEILPHYSIRNIAQISTKPGSSVYQIRLYSSTLGNHEIYAKKYGANCSSQIHEMMGLDENLLLLPRIIDYYEDENIVLSEGVKGITLTWTLLWNFLSQSRQTLLVCSQKMGKAIGYLQNQTNRGTKRIGDLDVHIIREIESQSYFKKILKRDQLKDILNNIEDLKDIKTGVSQYHGDPSPHNIIMNDHQVHLLDYSFQDNATFLDPSLYIVSLELMRHRLGLPMKKVLMRMENSFMDEYSHMTKETYDRSIWSIIKTLTYLHFLLMYSCRERTIPKTLVSAIDKRYLLKKIIIF